MSEQFEQLQEHIEKKLQEIDKYPSQCVEMSDEELVNIIGGAYVKAVNTRLQNKNTTFAAECTGGNCGGSCHVCTP